MLTLSCQEAVPVVVDRTHKTSDERGRRAARRGRTGDMGIRQVTGGRREKERVRNGDPDNKGLG